MKKKLVIPYIFIAIFFLILSGMLYFHFNYVVLNEEIYPRDLETLDLSGEILDDPIVLWEFQKLKELDLRNTGLTIPQYEQLHALLPQCHILWNVPFQGAYLIMETESLTLTDFTEDDITALQYLVNLRDITVIDCSADKIEALGGALPHCEILPRYTFGNTLVDRNRTIFQSTNIKNIMDVLEMFPQMSLIDATKCPNYVALSQLQAQYPDCKILYNVPLGDAQWREYTTDIRVGSIDSQELADALAALPWVKSIEITQPVPDPDLMLELREKYPDIEFTYAFDLFGKTVTTEDETVDISWVQLKSAADFEKYLPHFKNLKKAIMRRCGISNAEMDALRQRYPDIFFVWEVKIGRAWIRTDVTYFMPYQHRLVLYDADVDNLKYLTELICLDMGHMKVTRTDYLAYMPKMQYLLMCSTPITDISYCANMKDLKYCELFLTNVRDFSPLLECKNLVDLNVCYTKPSDPLIFAQMTQLENLWFRNMKDVNVQRQLRAALPNTNMVFQPGSSTGGGWRKLPNYYAQRDILHMPYMEED